MDIEVYKNLPQLAKSPTRATLTEIGSDTTFTFLVPPQSLKFSYQQERAMQPVLQTNNPLSRWKNSTETLSLPDVRLWTPANDRDLTEPLQTLAQWTRDQPPVLKFQWGSIGLEKCYLISFDFDIVQIRTGRPTQATGSIKLIPAPDITEPLRDESSEDEGVALTEREAESYSDLLKVVFPDANRIVLKPDGTVIIDGVTLPETIFDIEKAAKRS
jgi:hypothetical protein